MQLLRFQNLSSLKRVQTASFSISRTYLASCLRKPMTFSSTIEGTAQPPEPMRRRSMVSPLSVMVIGPTIEPLRAAKRCSSSRRASSVTSRSSMIGSDSSCSSKVFWRVSPMVCLVT